MIKADPARVLRDLYMLREIGRYETGVAARIGAQRHADVELHWRGLCRHWLVGQLHELGYAAHIDGIANVIGYSPAKGRKLLCGSHLETQNRAGWLDGALGIAYALEAARAVVESGGVSTCLPLPTKKAISAACWAAIPWWVT